MAGNERRGKGRLAAQFRELTSFSPSDRRQMVGSAVAIGAGYAGVGAWCALEPAVMQLVVKDFQTTHLPFHFLFAIVASAVGSAAVAAYDSYRERKARQSAAAPLPAPASASTQPVAPKPSA